MECGLTLEEQATPCQVGSVCFVPFSRFRTSRQLCIDDINFLSSVGIHNLGSYDPLIIGTII